jgi:hemolysin activation/secretion protein
MGRYHLFQSHGWMCDALSTLSQEKSTVNPSLGIDSDVDMSMLGLGLEANRRRPSTVTTLGLNLQYNLGGSDEDEFNLARPNSEPQFTRITASAMHRWYLAASRIHQLRGRFSGIYADRRLVPAKMTTFGGLYSVRGYREDEIVADGGILAGLEYGFSLSRFLGFELPQEQGEVKRFDFKPLSIDSYDIVFLGFTDYGNARIKDPIPGEIASQDLWSAGVGLEIEGGRNFAVRSYLGVALTDTESVVGTPQTRAGSSRWSFSFLLRY